MNTTDVAILEEIRNSKQNSRQNGLPVNLTPVFGFNTKNWYVYCEEYDVYYDINSMLLKPATNLQIINNFGLERDYGIMGRRIKFSFTYDTTDEDGQEMECGGELDIPVNEFDINEIQ